MGREARPQARQTSWIVQSARQLVLGPCRERRAGRFLGITKVSVLENLGISKKLTAVETSAG
jgi:hypothetical protein